MHWAVRQNFGAKQQNDHFVISMSTNQDEGLVKTDQSQAGKLTISWTLQSTWVTPRAKSLKHGVKFQFPNDHIVRIQVKSTYKHVFDYHYKKHCEFNFNRMLLVSLALKYNACNWYSILLETRSIASHKTWNIKIYLTSCFLNRWKISEERVIDPVTQSDFFFDFK